ncbi:aquaglyceroporin Gla [Lactococcus garvieae]|jgi:glycerol uptake facilitator protein|uniref:Glycerol uptake facilitator protein n=1 Tax=Lactococcus garvieae DCC43 TaxID=1231377 RepID=K2PQ69_9LACT|nr:aquaglyceroporin Gla [Lactococcus garvieae]EKF52459.1 Glycerol uptake facilitator protein [Lactococcus garvieae DCC43]QPS71015.1 aquaporin family protein [Lactococcus garvieae]
MDYSWTVKYLTEFIGTALLLILGNGAVANVELKGTKAFGQSWLIIAWGYGLGVMLPAVALGNVTAQINPAFTLGLAASGFFPWAQVPFYILAQLLGAMFGQLIIVMVYRPYYLKTENPNAILGTFSTIDNVDDGTITTHTGALVNGFLNEFVGSFVLFFGAMGLTKLYRGIESINWMTDYASQQGADVTSSTVTGQIAASVSGAASSAAVSHVVLGFLVLVLVASLGGPTGPGLNPARDLGPRILHSLLPKSVLGESKGSSKWWYAWVPVTAPILAALAAVALFKIIYL